MTQALTRCPEGLCKDCPKEQRMECEGLTTMHCDDCGWQGSATECHWNSHNQDDFEPDVFCPKCDSNDIETVAIYRARQRRKFYYEDLR